MVLVALLGGALAAVVYQVVKFHAPRYVPAIEIDYPVIVEDVYLTDILERMLKGTGPA